MWEVTLWDIVKNSNYVYLGSNKKKNSWAPAELWTKSRLQSLPLCWCILFPVLNWVILLPLNRTSWSSVPGPCLHHGDAGVLRKLSPWLQPTRNAGQSLCSQVFCDGCHFVVSPQLDVGVLSVLFCGQLCAWKELWKCGAVVCDVGPDRFIHMVWAYFFCMHTFSADKNKENRINHKYCGLFVFQSRIYPVLGFQCHLYKSHDFLLP